jgi:regulator of replication initiation timing
MPAEFTVRELAELTAALFNQACENVQFAIEEGTEENKQLRSENERLTKELAAVDDLRTAYCNIQTLVGHNDPYDVIAAYKQRAEAAEAELATYRRAFFDADAASRTQQPKVLAEGWMRPSEIDGLNNRYTTFIRGTQTETCLRPVAIVEREVQE